MEMEHEVVLGGQVQVYLPINVGLTGPASSFSTTNSRSVML